MRRLRGHRDDGFSLIEVIVAIVILGIVASSALWFFINGMQTSSNLDRQQTAVSIATSAMEKTFVVDPTVSPIAGVSGLVVGRSASDVSAAFTALGTGSTSLGLNSGAGIDGVATMYQLSDPAGGTPVIPIKDTSVKRAGVQYTVYTVVGACYREATTSGAEKPCQKVSGYGTTEPASTPVGSARMLRIIVVVTWDPIGAECNGTGGVCSYDIATLVDPSSDLAWNRVIKPVAADDEYTFSPGDPAIDMAVMKNDLLGSVRPSPVQLAAAPDTIAAGAGTTSANSNGTIAYTPPANTKAAWKSGIFPFKYLVYDRTGASSSATVLVKLLPTSADDSFTVTAGAGSQVLDVTANDLGSPADITISDPAKLGTVTAVGTTVTYTPIVKGNDTFSYYYTDASGQQTKVAAVVSVKVDSVTAYDTPVPATYITDATVESSWQDISSYLRGSTNPATTKIIIGQNPAAASGTTGAGKIRVDGVEYVSGVLTGTKVEFQPPANTYGQWTMPFSLTLGGYFSNVATATITVPPNLKAVDDDMGDLKRNGTRTLTVGTYDTPSTWGTGSGITKVELGSITNGKGGDCGSWATSSPTSSEMAAGKVSLKFDYSTASNCKATYTLWMGTLSSSATISYNVVK